MTSAIRIRRLAAAETLAAAPALAEVLVDCVQGGASVSFMAGLTQAAALAFWRDQAVEAEADGRAILAAEDAAGVVGVVQVIPAWAPNQPHRADISKLLVHRRARRKGAASRAERRRAQARLAGAAHQARSRCRGPAGSCPWRGPRPRRAGRPRASTSAWAGRASG